MWQVVHLIAIAIFFYTTIFAVADWVTGLRYAKVYPGNEAWIALSSTILILLLTWGELV